MKIPMSNVKCQMNVCPASGGIPNRYISWKRDLRHVLYKIIIPSFVIFNLSFVILSASAHAEEPKAVWATYGLLINDTPGNTTQQNPKIISDGYTGYIIIWEDGRAGYFDIYAQRVDESGNLMWEKNGVAACKYSGNQNFAQQVSDGTGGSIIVWQDYRNGNSDIYAQRLSYAGKPLWGEGGIPVSIAPAGQLAPEIISDGAGGAILTWHDYRSGTGEDIYAQRINPNGKALWEENGIPVSEASGTQWYPKIASDGAGGAIIIWTDGRAGSSDNNIYAQRLDPYGKTLWEKDGIPICSAPGNQEKPVALSAQDGVVIAWQDSRNENLDIYLQKLDANGVLKWERDGVAVCSFPYSQENPKLAPDGEGGAIVVWSDQRAEKNDIYAQRILQDGRIAWQENGRPLCKAEGVQKNPEIAKLKNQDWVVVWEDARKGKANLFAQKINSAGTPLWKAEGIDVASAALLQESPALAATPTGNVVLAWQDSRTGDYDIFSQKISADGELLWKSSGNLVCAAQGSVVQQNIAATFTSKGEIMLAFEDARSGFFNIYAQKINRAGALAWGPNGVVISKVPADQSEPQIVPDDAGGAILAWEDYRIENFPEIRVQRISSQGKVVWDSSFPVAGIKARQTNPLMISDGAGGAIIAWQDEREVLSLQDVYAQRISGQGQLLWGKNGKPVIAANGEQIEHAMIPDGAGGAFLAWTDFRRGDRNPDIYAQRINPKGDPMWKEDGALVCGAPDVQRSPKLVSDSEGGILVGWTDKGGGSYDIYAQRVNKSGQPLWTKDGIPINQLSRTQQNPQFGNNSVLVWEDYRYGNWDIFAGAVSPAGKLLWGEEGVAVSLIPHTQYAPQIVPWKNGSVIVAWEDYRSGNYYEIFIQELNSAGKPAWPANGIKVKSRDGGRTPKILASSSDNSFYVFWEDYTDGGRAVYGQRFIVD